MWSCRHSNLGRTLIFLNQNKLSSFEIMLRLGLIQEVFRERRSVLIQFKIPLKPITRIDLWVGHYRWERLLKCNPVTAVYFQRSPGLKNKERKKKGIKSAVMQVQKYANQVCTVKIRCQLMPDLTFIFSLNKLKGTEMNHICALWERPSINK